MARPTLAKLIATPDARFVWPMYSPVGIAIRAAMRTARPQITRCSKSRFGMPVVPVQLAGSRKKLATPSISGPPP